MERKLRDEIGAVLGGRPIQAADLPGLPYLEAVVQESLRLYPPAASMGRQVIEDDEIGGFSIPAGSEVLISQWAIHHDARFFPDPMTFSPERWLDGLEDRLPHFAYFPFGGGPRQCIGAGFAMQEARMILASVLQKYSLETADERPLVLKPSLTIRAKGGIRMRIGEAYFSSGIMPRPLQT